MVEKEPVTVQVDYSHKYFFPPILAVILDGKIHRFGTNPDAVIHFLKEKSIKQIKFEYISGKPANVANFEGMIRSSLSKNG